MIDKIYKETEEPITLHGLGFLQVKLQGNQRLHVWHPDLPKRSCYKFSAIHNHRFGFWSRILVGEMVNHDVQVMRIKEDDHETEPTHIAYLHEGERTEFGNRPWIVDYFVKVWGGKSNLFKAGENYEMAPYDYHWSQPMGNKKVATIMQKNSEYPDGAHSLCAIGRQPHVDFDRKQWSQQHLWDIVKDVLVGASNENS